MNRREICDSTSIYSWLVAGTPLAGRCPSRTGLITYTLEELLATKMRALFQRRKGRDLFDLWLGVTKGSASSSDVVMIFKHYIEKEGAVISKKEFMQNLATKQGHPGFLSDITSLLLPECRFDINLAFDMVRSELISKLI